MNNYTKLTKITEEALFFDNGVSLSSDHYQECCETHYLWFNDLTMDDFKNLEFDLTSDNLITKIIDYGIELNPVAGFPVKIPGYGNNNGYYSTDLKVILSNNKGWKRCFDISECQQRIFD